MLPVYPVIIFPILCIIIAGKNQQQQWSHQELSGAASCVPAPAKGLTSRFHRCHCPGLCFADHYHHCGGAMEIQGAAQHQDLWWVCHGWRSPFLFTHWGYTHIRTCASTYTLAWWCHGVLAECMDRQLCCNVQCIIPTLQWNAMNTHRSWLFDIFIM